ASGQSKKVSEKISAVRRNVYFSSAVFIGCGKLKIQKRGSFSNEASPKF
ncbi:MAG: hypothetical protein ACI8YP_003563, partial [Algoriphagus sp.]